MYRDTKLHARKRDVAFPLLCAEASQSHFAGAGHGLSRRCPRIGAPRLELDDRGPLSSHLCRSGLETV